MRNMPEEKRKNSFGMKTDFAREITSKRGISGLQTFVSALIVILIVCITVLSLVPPVSRDALVHHLALPKLYLKHGGMYEIPSMPFSYYPMNLQLLYMISLYLGNDIIPKLIHFTFALLTAWVMFSYLRSRINTLYALFGSLFFLSIPIMVKLSTTAYVDLGLIFFSTTSLLLLFKWAEKKFKLRYLLASAMMCGLGMGTKYNGIISFLLLTLMTPIVCERFSSNKSPAFFKPLSFGVLFLVTGLLVFSPWMARNYAWTKNPVYPLFPGWFESQNKGVPESPEEKEEGGRPLGIFVIRKEIYHEQGWKIALLPIRIFFQGKDGSPQYFDGKLNPFLLILPFFAFCRWRKEPEYLKKEKRGLLAFAVLFFAIALCTSDLRIRYISPIIPPLIILSIFGVKRIHDWATGQCKAGLRALTTFLLLLVTCLPLLYNGKYILEQFKYADPLSYLTGEVSRDEYISKYRPEYPAMQYINGSLPANAKVLFLFVGGRGYFSDRDYILGEGTLAQFVRWARTPEEISTELRSTGVTHLLIFHPLFERWVKDNFQEEKQKLLKKFFENYVQFVYFRDGFSVSSLRNPLS
jgi:hypothetical protein